MDKKQQETLKTFGFSIEEVPNLRTSPRMAFETRDGTVLENLHADPYHLKRYLARGLKPILDSKPQPREDSLTCDICGKECGSKIGLISHIRTHT